MEIFFTIIFLIGLAWLIKWVYGIFSNTTVETTDQEHNREYMLMCQMEDNTYREALNDNHIFDQKKSEKKRCKISACNLYCKPKKTVAPKRDYSLEYEQGQRQVLMNMRGSTFSQQQAAGAGAYYGGQSPNTLGGFFG